MLFVNLFVFVCFCLFLSIFLLLCSFITVGEYFLTFITLLPVYIFLLLAFITLPMLSVFLILASVVLLLKLVVLLLTPDVLGSLDLTFEFCVIASSSPSSLGSRPNWVLSFRFALGPCLRSLFVEGMLEGKF